MNNYLITFAAVGCTHLRRFRLITAAHEQDCIRVALDGARPETMKRLAKRTRVLMAYVGRTDRPLHPNGKPRIVESFRLTYTA